MLYVKLILWNSTTIIKWKVIQIRKDWSRLTFHINSISYSNLLMFYIYILTTAIFIESSVGTCQPSVCVCVSIYINYRNIYNVISRLPATQVSVCVCVCVYINYSNIYRVMISRLPANPSQSIIMGRSHLFDQFTPATGEHLNLDWDHCEVDHKNIIKGKGKVVPFLFIFIHRLYSVPKSSLSQLHTCILCLMEML